MRENPVTMHAMRRFVALGLALMGIACNSTPDFDKELDTVRSWTATVKLAAGERAAGATTRRFTAQLLDQAAEALEQSRQALQQAARSDPQRITARASIDSLSAALQNARGAVARR